MEGLNGITQSGGFVVSDREEFEEWAKDSGYALLKTGLNQYFYTDTAAAWDAWQAARATEAMEHGELHEPMTEEFKAAWKNGLPLDSMEARWAFVGWQAARAQSGQGVEVATDFRAEVRTERDICDEYSSYLVLISDGKSEPYMFIPENLDDAVLDEAMRRLNYAHPQPAQQGSGEAVAWTKWFNGKQQLVERDAFLPEDAISAGWKPLTYADNNPQPAQQGSVPEVFALCEKCHKEFLVPLESGGNATTDLLCNFCSCPHCDARNDLWIKLTATTTTKEQG